MCSVDVALSPMIKFSGCFESRQVDDDAFILIYLKVDGSLIPLRVLESDSIASVKLRIQTCKLIAAKKQKLIYEGRELARNDSLVKDYGVANGNVLHLVLKLSDLLLITVKTYSGVEYEFHVHRNRNVGYVKRRLSQDVNHEIFYNGEKLEDDDKLVNELCHTSDGAIHLFVQKSAKVKTRASGKDIEIHVVADQESRWEPLFESVHGDLNAVIQNMVNCTFEGMARGNPPVRSSEGTGGTYFMQHPKQDTFVSVFKPVDEEPNGVNNPHGLPVVDSGEGLKKGTRVGGGAIREVAAYILDHPINGRREITGEIMGFSGVPPTVMIKCSHEGFNYSDGFCNSPECEKIGSLQMFMKNNGSCEDMGPSCFPVEEVHKISVLDMRLANADRHGGNILVSKREEDGGMALIPIDHGYCLPESFEDCTFEWLNWPQAREAYSAEVVEYVRSLDAEEDIALLRSYGWNIPAESARTLRIATMMVKKGVAKGLTPFEIGTMMCRSVFHKASVIEEIVRDASECASGEHQFLERVSELMDARLAE